MEGKEGGGEKWRWKGEVEEMTRAQVKHTTDIIQLLSRQGH